MRFSDVGEHEFSNIRFAPEIQVVEYDHADLDVSAHTLKVPIPAGMIVLSVGHEVTEAFAGGTPALTIGDGDDADGYAKATAFTLGTVGNFVNSQGVGDTAGTTDTIFTLRPYATGKKYNTAGYILLTHAAGLTAGKGKVHIMGYSTLGNWRVPAQ